MSLEQVLVALADPTRRRVVEVLRSGERTVGELAAEVLPAHAMSLPAFSKHLRVLEDAGLVRRRKAGRTVVVTLVPAPLVDVERWAHDVTQHWSRTIDRLDTYLKEET